MVTKDEVLEKLSQVMDPELGINIVELGLIYEVEIKKKMVYIKMTFTTPACPMINEILHEVKKKLEELEGADVEVTVVFEPLWTPERMSERAKMKLGLI